MKLKRTAGDRRLVRTEPGRHRRPPCTAGNPAVESPCPSKEVAFQSADTVVDFWRRIFQGASVQRKTPFCQETSGTDLSASEHTEYFDFYQSNRELADPDIYTVTIRACTGRPSASTPATRPTRDRISPWCNPKVQSGPSPPAGPQDPGTTRKRGAVACGFSTSATQAVIGPTITTCQQEATR